MSNAIDSKVVEMKFDNRDFESNVKNSLSTIDKLKQALNFKGSEKGLEKLGDATKSVKFDGMNSGLETVRASFSALEVAGMTVISNLTSQAMQFGSALANMFVFDPPKSGFAEYEEYMGSIQTIQAGTGASIKEINAYLDELNTYADKTIYSFSDMTSNIGKFTNAGVDLRTAVKAIQGISNEAAVSGANTEMASRAMYNFAQALSAGYVKLIDWKSIENANMATKEFKQELIDTAVEMGYMEQQADGMYKVLTENSQGSTMDETISATKNFNDSLAYQWMTTDVLTTTLGRYSDETTDIGKKAFAAAQDVRTFSMMMDTLTEAAGSGWTTTWRLLVGDFDAAKDFWTEMTNFFSDIIQKSADARNELLGGALNDPIDVLNEALTTAGISAEDFQSKLIEVGSERGLNLQTAIDESGSLDQAMRDGRVTTQNVIDTLDTFASSTETVVDCTDELNQKLEYFQDVVDKVWHGDFKNAPERYQLLADAGYDYEKVQELVNKTVDGHRLTLEDLGEEQMKSIGYTEEEIAAFKQLSEQAKTSGTSLNEAISNLQRVSGRTLLIETLQNVRNSVFAVSDAIKQAWSETFGTFTSTMLYNIIKKLHDLSEAMLVNEERADQLKRIFKGILAPIKAVATIVKRVLNVAFENLSKILGNFNIDILEVLANIGDASVAFSEWVTSAEAMDQITEKLQNGLDFLRQKGEELLEWLKGLPIIGDIVSNVEGALGNLSGAIKTAVSNAKGAGKISDAFSGIGEQIRTEIEIGLKAITDGTVFDTIVDKLLSMKDQLINSLGEIVKYVVNIGNDFANGTKSFDYGPLVTFAAAIGILAGLYKFSKALSTVANMVKTIMGPVAAVTDLIQGLTGVTKQFSNLMKAAAQWTKSGAIMTVALSIVMVCGAIALLAQIPADQLGIAAGVVAGIAIALIAVFAALSKLGKVAGANTKMFGTIALFFISFSIAMGVIVAAIAIFGHMDGNTLGQGFMTFMGVLALLALLVGAIAGMTTAFNLGDKQVAVFNAIGKLMMKIAVSLLLVGVACAIIGSVSQEGINNAAIIIVTVTGALAVILGLVGFMSKAKAINGSAIYGIGKLFTSVGVMCLALAAALAIISVIPQDGLNRATSIMDQVAAFVAVLVVIAAIVPSGAAAVGSVKGLMTSMAIMLVAMAASIKMIADIDEESVYRAKDVVEGLALFIGGGMIILAKALSGVGGEKIAGTIGMAIGMAIAVAALALVVVLVGMVDLETLAKGVAVVGALAYFVSVMGRSFKNINNNTYMAVIAAGAVVAVMVVLLLALSYIDWETALQSMGKLALVVAEFAVLMRIVAWASDSVKDSGDLLINVGIMLAVVAVLVVLIAILSAIDPTNVLPNAVMLAVLLATMAGVLVVVSKFTDDAIEAAVAMAAMEVVALLAIGLLALLSLINPEGIIEKTVSLSVLLISLSVVIKILSTIGGGAMAAIDGIAALSALILALVAVVGIIGGLVNSIEGSEEAITKGLDILVLIAGKIGEAIGAFVGGIAVGFADSLVQIGIKLTQFGVAVMPFVELMKSVDDSVMNGVSSLCGALLMLTGADLIDGLMSFFGCGLDTSALKTKFSDIGTGVAAFATATKNVDGEKTEKAANAAASLAWALSNIPADAAYTTNFNNFKTNLETIGNAVAGFSKVSEGVKVEVVNRTTRSMEAIIDMMAKIPTSGGVFEFFTGKANYDGFKTGMENISNGVKTYSDNVTDLNYEAIQSSTDALTNIIDCVSNIPETGGVFQKLSGEIDLTKFSTNLTSLARALVNFSGISSEGVNGRTLDIDAVNNAISCAQVIADFCNNYLPNFNADGVTAFTQAITNLGDADLNSFIDTFNQSQDTAEQAGNDFMSAFLRGMQNATQGITDWCGTVSSTVLSAIQSDNGGFFTAGVYALGEIQKGFLSNVHDVESTIRTVIGNIAQVVANQKSNYQDAASGLSAAIGSGFQNGAAGLSAQVRDMMGQIVSLVSSMSSGFRTAGYHCAIGLANGISSGSGYIRSAAISAAKSALTAAKDTLGVNSPSKEFMKIGVFSAMGLARGFDKSDTIITKSASGMANNALGAVTQALSSIGTMDSGSVSIKPVVDFGNMSKYGGTLDFSASIGSVISTPINNNSKMLAQQMQQSNAIAKKLEKLRKEVSEISKPTYNVGGITYDDGSNVASAVRELTRAVKVERRK